ncbi:GGDEF domain-containing phosphodiesterase [Alginatibacterium sediminis]|uniref:GGDEF domain-containing phosphodiesterase n=1 Tax=Alginatibacterium sediminis TaxID=2164068 RepID=UPI001314F6DD|nr:GGDEF domain-containing phosphodiesterase [Alginatibacterium sediminis]
MSSLRSISLKLLVPAMATLLLVIVAVTMLQMDLKSNQVELISQAKVGIRSQGYILQQSLSDSLSRNQVDIAERSIMLAALDEQVRDIVVLDPQASVLLSNRLIDKHLFASETVTDFDRQAFEATSIQGQEQSSFDAENKRLSLYLPLDMGPRSDSLSPSAKGAIYISYDLSRQWSAIEQGFIQRMGKYIALVFASLLVVVFFVYWVLLRPLSHLLKHSQNKQAPVKLKGQGEIGKLQRVMNNMNSNMLDSFTQLQNSEKRWQFALTGSGDGVFDWDFAKKSVFFSPQWAKMLGFDEGELTNQSKEWESRIHSDDLHKTLASLRAHFKGETESFECMHRMQTKDGRYIWVMVRAMVIERDVNKRPLRMIGTQTNISDIRAAQETIEFQSSHDDITRLANRRKLIENLEQEIENAGRRKTIGVLIYLDLDHFKNVNDLLGHAAGDLLLRLVAHRLRENYRQHETIARLGGDEYAILIPDLGADHRRASLRARKIAENIRNLIRRPFAIKGNDISLNATIGLAMYPNQDSNATEILRQADMALYHGKDAGRGSVCLFSSKMAEDIQQRHKLQQMMRVAITQEDMVAYFQPRYNSQYEMVGAETLVRWYDNELGWISPGRFIPLAEESGLIILLGKFIMRSAFSALKRWQDRGLPKNFTTLSVNVSPNQFHREDFVDSTIDVIRSAGCDPRLIELEITEGVLVDNVKETVEKISRLRALGIRFSVDDFGTGYSSLAYLNQLPINCLKIDKSFVSEVEKGGSECSIITTIISMAENLDLEVIAEGVETEYQLEFLKFRGCTVYQGFYFSEALEPDIFEDRLFARHDQAVSF